MGGQACSSVEVRTTAVGPVPAVAMVVERAAEVTAVATVAGMLAETVVPNPSKRSLTQAYL